MPECLDKNCPRIGHHDTLKNLLQNNRKEDGDVLSGASSLAMAVPPQPAAPPPNPFPFNPDQLLTSVTQARTGSATAAPSNVDKDKLRDLLSQIFNFVTKQCDDQDKNPAEVSTLLSFFAWFCQPE